MRDIAFALVWGVMFPITFWSAHVGVLLWVWVALIAPNEQMYSFAEAIPYNKVIAVVTLAMLVANRERKQYYADAMVVAMIALVIVATGSALNAIPGNYTNWDIYSKFLKEIALALVICSVMWTRHRIHMLLFAVCFGYGFVAMSEGGQFLLTAGGHKILGSSSVGDNNQLATAVLMIIPPLLYLIQYSAWQPAKLALIFMLSLSVLCVVGTFSRGGFIGLVILGAMVVRNSRYKVRTGVAVLIAAGVVLALAPESWYERLSTLHEAGSDDSFMQRVTIWKISTLIALDHPFLGGGLHAVQSWTAWTTYAARLPFLESIPTPPPDPFPRAAHSSYFEILGDMGFLGLGLFLILLLASIVACSRTIRLCRRKPEMAWATDLARMLQVSLVIYAVTTFDLSMGYFEGVYVFMALSSRLLRTARQAVAGTLEDYTGPPIPKRVPLPGRPPAPLGGPVAGPVAARAAARVGPGWGGRA